MTDEKNKLKKDLESFLKDENLNTKIPPKFTVLLVDMVGKEKPYY